METIYFDKKSQMTTVAKSEELLHGAEYFRTRLVCDCMMYNRRDGILITNADIIVYRLIRCKACARKGAQNGTL